MLTPPYLIRRAVQRLRSRDPEYDALLRAVRAAIVVPLAAAVSFTIAGNSQTPLFAIFGSFALMVLADFPGNRQTRALAYAGLGFNGAVLITLGTLVAPIPWLAVMLMFLLGVAVTLVGVLSETIAAGQRATLLMFVLPACTPPGPVGERLLGWLIALAICVPSALFLLPPRHHDQLRRRAARVCAALADRLEGNASADDVARSMDALRASFLGVDFRPVGLSAGSRALVRVVDDLEWLTDRVDDEAREFLTVIREPAIRVLRRSAHLLRIARVARRAASRAELGEALQDLRSVARGRYREDIAAVLAERDDAAAVALGREHLISRTIAATIAVTGRIIAAAAAADARPVWARALGRQLPVTGAAERVLPEGVAITTIPTGFLATRSVAARNSLRTGLGLALAVAITHLFPVQHGFWVVLAAMSVLRSSALTTGTKVVRAVAGTAIGFLLGAALIALVGVDPVVLWTLLPFVVFGSAYVPEVASFAAGQVAFTMWVLIIFNLIAPTGWRVGLIRIQDVVVGALVGVVVSLLLWPRGATGSVSAAVESARVVGSRYLRAAVLRITRGSSEAVDDGVTALSHDALRASRTLDDAVRQYLSESGGDTDARAPVVRASNRVIRLRGAADLIADIQWPAPLSVYPRARAVLEEHAEAVCERLAGLADPAAWAPVSDDLVRAIRAESTGDDVAVSAALPLVNVAAYLGELELIYPRPSPTSEFNVPASSR
jgi:fusaric acid resistance family protein